MQQTGPGVTTCYRHPDRVAGAVCRRCNRPICPDCMREAPVGWQCERCVHDDSRRPPSVRWRPRQAGPLGSSRLTPATVALIAVNVVVFLLEERHFDNVVSRFALVPAEVHQGQVYRLLTAAFLHANTTHILFNMVTLAIIGPPVESAVGRARFLALYLVCALGGSVCSYLLSPPYQGGVGASGAIFGLMGAYFVLARRHGWDVSAVGALIVLNLVISFADPGIDWHAHVGGLVVGGVVAWAFSAAEGLPNPRRLGVEAATVAACLGVLALLVQLPPGHVHL